MRHLRSKIGTIAAGLVLGAVTAQAATAATAARPAVHWSAGFTNGLYLTVYATPAIRGSGVVQVTADVYSGGGIGQYTDTFTSKRQAAVPPGRKLACAVGPASYGTPMTWLVVSPPLLSSAGIATVRATVQDGIVRKCAAWFAAG